MSQLMSQDLTADEKAVVHYEDDPEDGKKRRGVNNQLDEAKGYLESAGHVEYTKEEHRGVLWRIDWHVCLPMCLVYMIQQMDKQCISYGSVFDLISATKLHGTQLSWLTSVVYPAQLFAQPISAYALIVFPVKWWIVFNFFAWSCCTMCTAAATNFTGLLLGRLFLGIFEATILPSFVLVTQMWWTRREQSYRMTAVQIANSVASIIGPLISWGIGHATKGIHAYQGIFLVVGGISMAFVPFTAWLLPNSPTEAPFLRRGQDRLIALDRIKENNTGTKSTKFKKEQMWETLRDPKTWLWALIYLFNALPAGGFGNFGGLITKGFGFTSFAAILMQMPTGGIIILTLLLSIWITNRIKMRFPVLAVLTLFPIAGGAALFKVNRKNTGGLLGAYYTAFVFGGITPLLYSWANLNASGTTKRVVTTAIMFVFQCAGNVVGPQLYMAKESPLYFTGLKLSVCFWCVSFCLIVTQGMYLMHLNRRQEKRRAALGLPAKLKDISLMSHNEADKYKVELLQILREHRATQAQTGGAVDAADVDDLYANAFDDLTDFENPMFMYAI